MIGIHLGLRAIRPKPVLPTIIGSSLAMWLRGDAVTLNGSTVSSWNDRSGNTRHALQGAAGAQPTLVANGIGGQPALSFDGGDYMDVTNLTVSRPYTVIVVGTSTSQNGRFFHDGVSVGSRTVLYGPSGTQIAAYGSVAITATADASSAKIYSALHNSTSSTLRINGSSTSGNLGLSGLASGLRIGVAADLSAGSYLIGRIAEIIVASRALTAAENALIERYLSHRYGITVA